MSSSSVHNTARPTFTQITTSNLTSSAVANALQWPEPTTPPPRRASDRSGVGDPPSLVFPFCANPAAKEITALATATSRLRVENRYQSETADAYSYYIPLAQPYRERDVASAGTRVVVLPTDLAVAHGIDPVSSEWSRLHGYVTVERRRPKSHCLWLCRPRRTRSRTSRAWRRRGRRRSCHPKQSTAWHWARPPPRHARNASGGVGWPTRLARRASWLTPRSAGCTASQLFMPRMGE